MMPDDGRRQFEQLYSSAQRELGEALALLRESREECARLTEELDGLRAALPATAAAHGPRGSALARALAGIRRRVRKVLRRR